MGQPFLHQGSSLVSLGYPRQRSVGYTTPPRSDAGGCFFCCFLGLLLFYSLLATSAIFEVPFFCDAL
jgi:hypothetical protein